VSAALTLGRLEAAGVLVIREGESLRLRGAKPEPILLEEARIYKAELLRLLAEREAEDAAERAAIQDEPQATLPEAEHRRVIAGYVSAAQQRPPSWVGQASIPSFGSYCGCCSRQSRRGGRWWREAVNPSGWCCWACHPPVHLPPEGVVEVRT
jgi:hypothetical protein